MVSKTDSIFPPFPAHCPSLFQESKDREVGMEEVRGRERRGGINLI